MYREIELLRQDSGKQQVAFAAIHTNGTYDPTRYLPKQSRGVNIPLVLMLMRWDGFIGFPGGGVNRSETLVEGLCRETLEEIDYALDTKRLLPMVSYTDDRETVNVHCYSYKVCTDEMKDIIRQATFSDRFLIEHQGCFAAQVAEFEGVNGFAQFCRHNFKASAGPELQVLTNRILV